jgi:hypothetical protein
MQFIAWLQITAHYYPIISWIGAGIFIAGGISVLWAIDRAGGMV